jgi:hypothetical protein
MSRIVVSKDFKKLVAQIKAEKQLMGIKTTNENITDMITDIVKRIDKESKKEILIEDIF